MKKINYISQLFQYFLGKKTDSDATDFQQWRMATKENETIYTEIEKIVDWTADYPFDYQPDVEGGLLHLKNQIAIEKAEDKREEQQGRFSTRRSYWRIAAAIALLVVTATVLNVWLGTDNLSVYTTTETQTVELEDGSIVYLNEDSELHYAEDFGDCHRVLELKGEAFFEVSKNVDCPFVVETSQTTITVLGTAFNVKALPSVAQTEVMVTSGKVEVESNKSEQKTILLPEEKITHVHGQSLTKTKDKNYHSVAWHTLEFKKETIGTIVKAMEKIYQVDIDLSQTPIQNCLYTLDLNKHSLKNAFDVLQTSFQLDIEDRGNNTFILKGGDENCSNIN